MSLTSYLKYIGRMRKINNTFILTQDNIAIRWSILDFIEPIRKGDTKTYWEIQAKPIITHTDTINNRVYEIRYCLAHHIVSKQDSIKLITEIVDRSNNDSISIIHINSLIKELGIKTLC